MREGRYAMRLSMSWSSAERHADNGGGWGDCNRSSAVSPKCEAMPDDRRKATISATQKRVGVLSNSSRESQAMCDVCRFAQAVSSIVLPQPAEAESNVSGVQNGASSAESR